MLLTSLFGHGHEGKKERLVMEKEAVIREKESIKSQLVSFDSWIKVFVDEVEKLVSKVCCGISNLWTIN